MDSDTPKSPGTIRLGGEHVITVIRTLPSLPTTVFRQARDRSAWSVFLWYLGALAIYMVTVSTLAYSGIALTAPPTWLEWIIGLPPLYPSAIPIPLWVFVVVVVTLSHLAVYTLIPELTIRAVFGREQSKGIHQSFKAVAISSIPILALAGLPIIGTLITLLAIPLDVVGLRELHNISTKQAIIAVLLVPALLLALLIVFLIPIMLIGLFIGA